MKKILSVLLAGLMLVSVLALTACSDTGAGPEVTTAGAAVTTEAVPEETTEDLYDANGYLKDKIPEDVNYNNADLNILAVNEQKKQVWVDPDKADLSDSLSNALYTRIVTLEERLGVKINFVWEDGNWNNRDAFINKVDAAVKNGGADYDVVMAYNLNPPVMATKGLLEDINGVGYLDFTNPWWPKTFYDTVCVNGHVYFADNIVDYGSIRNMACVMFEKSLTGKHNISDDELYNLALDGGWTLEKLEGYIAGSYEEANGDNTRSYGDVYGLGIVDNARLDSFLYGCGLKIVDKSGDGTVSLQMGDERFQTVLERVNKLVHDNEDVYGVDKSMYAMFKAAQAMFYITPIAIVDQKLDFDFGVLPVPKFDADQPQYGTYFTNTHESWCAPRGCRNPEMSANFIEAFSSEAYREIMPVYFETMLKYRYSSDNTASQVYDIIRENAVIDFGYMFANSFSQNPFLLYRQQMQNNTNAWSSVYKTFAKKLPVELDDIIASLADPQ